MAREEAVEAARDLLLAGGASAVTLKAVGERMGVGHANLIHHFGSAAGLQGAVMDRMVRDLAERLDAGLAEAPANPGRAAMLDQVFDAFGEGGAARLGAWMVMQGEAGRADAFAEVVRDQAERLAGLAGGGEEARDRARAVVMTAVYMAFADGLIGEVLTQMLGAPRDLGRGLATRAIEAVLNEDLEPGGDRS
ncbi:TetR family transcriptional regulator [uncultured Brevundimonas sp.]|uniref:TetR/AcrR family transcriptional regulator n=1 Tax=uncultured Brevundimonas sp. TaxID=213418 RepID=UPI0025FA97C7|nr:TetR family transcriptional regulator [uncultured Brevundimonas sp.]